MASAFEDALAVFIKGCENIIQKYEESCPLKRQGTGPEYITLWGPTLEPKYGKKYVKLIGSLVHNGRQYTFAVVDIITGNVYRPSSSLDGSVNIKTAKVKGNIFDDDHGLSNVDHTGPRAEYSKNKQRVI